jgi:hypothetical protein
MSMLPATSGHVRSWRRLLLALVALLGVAALAGTASAEPNSSCGEGCATSSCAQRCDRAWIGSAVPRQVGSVPGKLCRDVTCIS